MSRLSEYKSRFAPSQMTARRGLLPCEAERRIHGNASFLPAYVERAVGAAVAKKAGIALMHSHLGPGWQGMSPDDIAAEQNLAPTAQGATGQPLVGLTLGTDGAWSARFWPKRGIRHYERQWCESVRVCGDALRVTYQDQLLPIPACGPELTRTVSAWGDPKQAELARLHIGIVGTGSVGCLIAEALARMGICRITLLDFDAVELINLDRLLHATNKDVGRAKVAMLADALRRSATARKFSVNPLDFSVTEEPGFRAALDCDALFSCVDRPWARFALNLIAYAHLIPVIDGGLAITTRPIRGLRHCSIRAHIAAPERRCLECLGQYKSEFVSMERDGLLDDPKYINGLPDNHPLKQRQNVFSFSALAASLELMQLLSMVVAPSGVGNSGAQVYHFVAGTIDKEDKLVCDEACFFRSIIGRGDHAGISATGTHFAAERARLARTKATKMGFWERVQRLWRFRDWN